MDLFKQPEILARYLEQHSTPADPVLEELSRHTFLKETYPGMISGHILGSFLSLFSRLISPEHILEVGTYTGYAAICLARGLRTGGRLITLEINEELRDTSLKFFEKAGLADRIELINGDARTIIPELSGPFDLVFLDAQKEDYPLYYDLLIERVSGGGYILADNVLWGGKVLQDPGTDAATAAIHRFNRKVTSDRRVENLMLPIRDGLMLIKKR
jgi:predicted O-methyltransferase YrrM